MGQREAALEAAREAVNRYRTLAKSRPDAFLPDLAASLQNLGMHLSNAGDHEPALEATREAVDTYRTLAKSRPDAFLPDLATELNNLGVVLSDLGQREAALEATREAVDAFRSLAKARPDAFLPDLVTSLDNLGFDSSATWASTKRRLRPRARQRKCSVDWKCRRGRWGQRSGALPERGVVQSLQRLLN